MEPPLVPPPGPKGAGKPLVSWQNSSQRAKEKPAGKRMGDRLIPVATMDQQNVRSPQRGPRPTPEAPQCPVGHAHHCTQPTTDLLTQRDRPLRSAPPNPTKRPVHKSGPVTGAEPPGPCAPTAREREMPRAHAPTRKHLAGPRGTLNTSGRLEHHRLRPAALGPARVSAVPKQPSRLPRMGATLGGPTQVKVSRKAQSWLCSNTPAGNAPPSWGVNVAFAHINQGSGPTGF